MIKLLLAVLLCATLGSASAAADGKPEQTAEQFLASLHIEKGAITLPGAIATLNLTDSFRYLPPADAERLLTEGWGNPPGVHTLGMIIPTSVSPLARDGWGVAITYDKDGHVADGDADSIKYDEMLKEMQQAVEERNAERKKQGYGAMSLVGWAETPHYDKAQHKLYWAKELRSEGAQQTGLNYNIRVLGREGVLVLNAIAGMNQLESIKQEMKQVTAFTNFTAGNRYTDFNASTDKTAEYGLAALVAGGVAAKLGLFGKLLALLVAFKKLILLAVAGAGSAIWKFFKREPKEEAQKPKVDLSK